MSKIKFSQKDIEVLEKNTNVLTVSELSITYSDEFKNRFINEYSKGEIIKKQAAQIKLLEGQVDLLKKLEKTERMLLSKGKNIKTSEKFQLIYETIAQNNFKQMTTYFCELLEVSRSGYYSYI